MSERIFCIGKTELNDFGKNNLFDLSLMQVSMCYGTYAAFPKSFSSECTAIDEGTQTLKFSSFNLSNPMKSCITYSANCGPFILEFVYYLDCLFLEDGHDW